jgi:hypothetical protein
MPKKSKSSSKALSVCDVFPLLVNMEGLQFPSLIGRSSPGHRRSQLVLAVMGLASTVLAAPSIKFAQRCLYIYLLPVLG